MVFHRCDNLREISKGTERIWAHKSTAGRAHAAKQQRHLHISFGEHARLRVNDVTSVTKPVLASLLAFCKRILVAQLSLRVPGREQASPASLLAVGLIANRRMPGVNTS